MRRSIERILTTHTGSLPRPLPVVELLFARDSGAAFNASDFDQQVKAAVNDAVRKQIDAGVAIINDGEQGKSNFFVYRHQRLTGFELVPDKGRMRTMGAEAEDFPEFYKRWLSGGQVRKLQPPPTKELCCTGPVGWKDFSDVERDIANLKAAASGVDAELFMTAISPGCYLPRNEHYRSEEEYLQAVADAMGHEYTAIVQAGFVLQIDAPDLTTHYRLRRISVDEHLRYMRGRVDAINHATRNLPADRIRVHVCWGADEAPHHRDVPLKDILAELLRLRPHGMTIPGANGRHAHEWRVWEGVKLPAEKVIIPGVIDSTTNIIEHPEAVAQRIANYASVLGRERLIAGVDCGFDTMADMGQVDPKIVWAKLRALGDGAALASKALFGR